MPRTSRAARIVTVVHILALTAACLADAGAPPDRVRATPLARVLYPPSAAGVPLETTAFEVSSEGALSTESAAVAWTEGYPVDLTFHLRPYGALPDTFWLIVGTEGEGPPVSNSYAVSTNGWQVGGVYAATVSFRQPGLRFSGRAALTIAASADEAGQSRRQTLWREPIAIGAARYPARHDAQGVIAVFGAGTVSLDAAFRLGPGAQLLVPCVVEGPVRAIGLVSALAHDTDFKQGQCVCRIDCIDASGEVAATACIVAGETTAYGWYDYYGEGEMPHRKIPVFASSPVAAQGERGKAFESHVYAAAAELSAPCKPAQLVFTYLHDRGVIGVDDVAVISAAGAVR